MNDTPTPPVVFRARTVLYDAVFAKRPLAEIAERSGVPLVVVRNAAGGKLMTEQHALAIVKAWGNVRKEVAK